MFIDIEIEKKNSNAMKILFFKTDIDIKKVLISNKISFGEKNCNTSLVTCTMIIKLSQYI